MVTLSLLLQPYCPHQSHSVLSSATTATLSPHSPLSACLYNSHPIVTSATLCDTAITVTLPSHQPPQAPCVTLIITVNPHPDLSHHSHCVHIQLPCPPATTATLSLPQSLPLWSPCPHQSHCILMRATRATLSPCSPCVLLPSQLPCPYSAAVPLPSRPPYPHRSHSVPTMTTPSSPRPTQPHCPHTTSLSTCHHGHPILILATTATLSLCPQHRHPVPLPPRVLLSGRGCPGARWRLGPSPGRGPGGSRPGGGRCRAVPGRPGRGDISREKGAGGGIRHCRPGSAGPAPQVGRDWHRAPGTGGHVMDRDGTGHRERHGHGTEMRTGTAIGAGMGTGSGPAPKPPGRAQCPPACRPPRPGSGCGRTAPAEPPGHAAAPGKRDPGAASGPAAQGAPGRARRAGSGPLPAAAGVAVCPPGSPPRWPRGALGIPGWSSPGCSPTLLSPGCVRGPQGGLVLAEVLSLLALEGLGGP